MFHNFALSPKMTLIVGMNLGTYSLLAADTRITYYPGGLRMFRDDEKKVRRTSMGLITGAGIAELLDPVKQQLQVEQITVIDRIIEVVAEQLPRVQLAPWATDPRVVDALQTTGWMFTFIGTDNETDPPTHPLRLGILGTANTHIHAVQPNQVYLFPPSGTMPEQHAEWFRFAKDNLRTLTNTLDAEALAQNIAHHAHIVQELMRTVSLVNEGVAATFQIGVHILPFLTGVTSIIGPDSIVEFEWYDGNEPL